MKIAYLDCFSGISGNMILGALVDAGLQEAELAAELKKLPLSGYRMEIRAGKRASIAGTLLRVVAEERQPVRGLNKILSLLEQSSLTLKVREMSEKIFRLLASAEAEVHAINPESVHFHEVGAVDSIVDIVGSVIGMELLGIDRIVASPVNMGRGTVTAQHGVLPVPVPAAVSLLRGCPTYGAGVPMELTTPTGAALLAGMVREFGGQPLMQVERTGCGLGEADPDEWPNLLRVFIGEEGGGTEDICWMIESNIDDMNPEIYGHVMERLFAGGALDVTITPLLMKRGRPATRISILSPLGLEESLSGILFQETTALGIRRYRVERRKLHREIVQVKTMYGEISVKLGRLKGKVINQAPEFSSCEKAASRFNVPLKEVYQEAIRALRNQDD